MRVAISLRVFWQTKYLNISIFMHIVDRPSNKIFSTHEMLWPVVENGDEKDASESLKEIPMSPYFMAAQSFALSPIILFYNEWDEYLL